MTRTAEIRSRGVDAAAVAELAVRVAAYLPANYTARVISADVVEVSGRDMAGWTLDGYVIPRLQSAMIWAVETLESAAAEGSHHVVGDGRRREVGA